MPALIAAHPKGKWLILKHLPPGRRPDKWQAADYLLAIDQLAVLHDRFWGLAQDLSIYPWLEYPLQSGLSIYVKAAKADAQHLQEPVSKVLAQDTDISAITNQIIDHLQGIVSDLRALPATLLHGDYWPGNIHIHPNSGLTVFDWEDAAIGPAVLDLLSFIQGSTWQFGKLPLPPGEIIAHYRSRLAQTGSHVFKDDDWAQMWDNALMWTFVTGWINILSRVPDALLTTRLAALEAVLFQPLKAAVERRLK
jgi:thiamine kinase-like enzyme